LSGSVTKVFLPCLFTYFRQNGSRELLKIGLLAENSVGAEVDFVLGIARVRFLSAFAEVTECVLLGR